MKQPRLVLGVAAAVLAALLAGFLAGRGTRPRAAAPGAAGEVAAAPRVWTCSMHPQVRLDGPGKCPICEMPLIPADAAPAPGAGVPRLTLSAHALAMAGVETAPVEIRKLTRGLRAVGKVRYDESSLATVTARVDGYVERLFVSVTGVDLRAGDHLAEIYSPELLVAQQELLIALEGGRGPSVEAARVKLLRWGLTEAQVAAVVETKKIAERATLYSPIGGTVIEKAIVENSAFHAGDALFRIANLDRVWVYLDIYEYDLAWIRTGQEVEIAAEAFPGRTFAGRVSFVEPVLDEATRTVRVPVLVENRPHSLKPGMYVTAVIRAALGPDGTAAPTGVEGKYTCTMHPQVLQEAAGPCPSCGMPLVRIPGDSPHAGHGEAAPVPEADRYACPMKCEGEKTYDHPGNCPVCGMKLEKVASAPARDRPAGGGLPAVPASAVLDSGTRTIVYVEKGAGTFEPREVALGPRAGDFYPVLKGLEPGERVVTRGGFLIDSQFQITGHPSLYYPGGLGAGGGRDPAGAAGGSGPAPGGSPQEHGHEHSRETR